MYFSQYQSCTSKVKVPAGSGCGEGPLPGCRLPASLRVLARRKAVALWGPSYRGTNPVRDSTLTASSPPRGPASSRRGFRG